MGRKRDKNAIIFGIVDTIAGIYGYGPDKPVESPPQQEIPHIPETLMNDVKRGVCESVYVSKLLVKA